MWAIPPESGLIFMATLRQVSSTEVCEQERGMLEGQGKTEKAASWCETGILVQIYTQKLAPNASEEQRQTEIHLFKPTFIAGLSQK